LLKICIDNVNAQLFLWLYGSVKMPEFCQVIHTLEIICLNILSIHCIMFCIWLVHSLNRVSFRGLLSMNPSCVMMQKQLEVFRGCSVTCTVFVCYFRLPGKTVTLPELPALHRILSSCPGSVGHTVASSITLLCTLLHFSQYMLVSLFPSLSCGWNV